MTEDTTAQLREQIAVAIECQVRMASSREYIVDNLMSIVLAQLEAAKAIARRDALLEAADDWDAWPGNELAFSGWLRAQASAQGATAQPALADGTTPLDHAGHGCSVDPFQTQNDPSVTEAEER